MTPIVQPEESKSKTTIQHFYAGQSVLITGGTGFIGKILIEKLLRCCPELSSIYVLVRRKNGQDIHNRVEQILEEAVFDRLKSEFPKFRKKIIAVEGDCKLPGLGISAVDRDFLLREVSIVFHMAATVRFNEKLKHAVAINVNGTKEMIDLCKSMQNLKAFIHVSTLYSNCNRKEIDEKFYDPPITGDKILKLTQILDENIWNELEIFLKKDFPNTYSYTKAIAEQVVQQYAKKLPAGVFRPGMVMSTYQEPLPGWINNTSGPTGLVLAGIAGLLRIVNCNQSLAAELVPADLTVNSLIASAWDVALNKSEVADPLIYNYSATWTKSINWKEYNNLVHKHEIPSIKCFWFLYTILVKNYFLYYIASVFLQTFPAILIDAGLIATRQKTWAVKTSKKIDKLITLLSYFTLREWKFNNDRTKSLWKKISLDDQKIFPFSMENFDWDDFMKNCMMGIRVYLLKDPLDTVPVAKKQRTRVLIAHTILKYTVIILGTGIFYKLITFFF